MSQRAVCGGDSGFAVQAGRQAIMHEACRVLPWRHGFCGRVARQETLHSLTGTVKALQCRAAVHAGSTVHNMPGAAMSACSSCVSRISLHSILQERWRNLCRTFVPCKHRFGHT